MAPKNRAEGFIAEKLGGYGYLQENQSVDEDLKRRIEYAFNWIRDFEEIRETPVSLSEAERKAIAELVEVLETEDEPDKIQNAIFNVAKSSGLQPSAFFRTLYGILLGVPQGPRLGPYVLAMGKQNVVAALQRALGKS
jgi:lysyl-tRNA synthetase class 1